MQTSENAYCNANVLLRLVQGGSPEAIDRITRCYGQRLLAAGNRYCRTHAEAEDAVQDALLAASANLSEFRGDGSLEGWLVRIVANACRHLGRGKKNDARSHVDSDTLALASAAPSPFSVTCRSELARRLEQALLSLSHEDRLSLVLFELEGWSTAEIAAELGLSPGAVRTRLSRARTRMRSALEIQP